ncbi:peptidylprolyl isomerase [Candidatus Gracilibacteria bacterium]|nr:peptidylprolyl isomerase [Candidatus Gracilibacteria bacterium]MCF7819193.1 peptidylprolyl isomerase [Candidatus Gracilibacteria bacterium]
MLSASVFKEPSDRIVLQTNMGDIEIRLLPEHAPDIAENFRLLAQDNYYDGVPFHRIIKGFMIQSGDFENFDGTGGHAYGGGLLEDEFSPQLSHVRGAVSMANRGPNTNGSQFFIVQKDAPFLDGKHSIFGQVVNGMDTVDRIANVKTDLNDAPLETVEIKNVLVP